MLSYCPLLRLSRRTHRCTTFWRTTFWPSLALFLVLTLSGATAAFAAVPTFQHHTYPAGIGSPYLVALDFNGDGHQDVLMVSFGAPSQDTPNPPSGLLFLGNGDGSLQSPISLGDVGNVFAAGDLDHDGFQDALIEDADNRPLTVIWGNSTASGTDSTVVADVSGIYAAILTDFNGDGNPDVVYSDSQGLFAAYGDGHRHFATPIQLAVARNSGESFDVLAAGDFDGDGHTDLAAADLFGTTENLQTDRLVLYGDGAGSSTPVWSSLSGFFAFTSADMNSDGRSDLVGTLMSCFNACDSEVGLFGNANRTFSRRTLATFPQDWTVGAPLVADFDGDGVLDVVAGYRNSSTTDSAFLKGNADGSLQAPVSLNLGQQVSRLADLNNDLRPDLLATTQVDSTHSNLDVFLNTTAGFTACSAPTSDGVHVCQPAEGATVSSPVQVKAQATVTGGVYRFELWVDHVKALTVRDSGAMDAAVPMDAGSHLLEFVARNSAGDHVSASRTITVSSGGGTCAAPTSAGVTVCTPEDGATVGTTFPVEAYANVSGGVYRFELWANGNKVLTVRDSGAMKASVTLAPGSYRLDFVAQNASGTHVSATEHITVSSSTSCSVPTSPGVVVCTPQDGATVASSFAVKAYASISGGVYRFEMWANGTKVYTARDSGTMNTTLTLPAGTYRLDFVARNSAGDHLSKTIHVTVQ